MCETNCLQIGHPAPNFITNAWDPRTPAVMDKKISLSDFKGKWILLFFYPLDFTFVCPTELIHLGELREKFEKVNCQIIASSTDSIFSHQAWAKQDKRIAELGFPILSDMSHDVAYDYSVLHNEGMSLRGAFIIDPDGILQSMTVNNLPVGRNPEELLRTLKAFQTGDLCPVNWDEGKKTLGKA
jgi:peroxiredoxin (alkyl hydroperoxide reductase subunit C)